MEVGSEVSGSGIAQALERLVLDDLVCGIGNETPLRDNCNIVINCCYGISKSVDLAERLNLCTLLGIRLRLSRLSSLFNRVFEDSDRGLLNLSLFNRVFEA